MQREQVALQATSPLRSKRLRWLVLTMIASEMSPLKQRAWQDCGAFSWRGVHQARLFIMHPLLLTVPLTHVRCIVGLVVFRLEWAVRTRSHLVSSGVFLLRKICRWIGSSFSCVCWGCLSRVWRSLWKMTFGALSTLLGKMELHPDTLVYQFGSWGEILDKPFNVRVKSLGRNNNTFDVPPQTFYVH